MKKFFIHLYGIVRISWYTITKNWNGLENFCKDFIKRLSIEKSFYYYSLAKALQKQKRFAESVNYYKKIVTISKKPHPYDYFDLIRALYESKIYHEIPKYCILLLKENFGILGNFAKECILEQIYWYLAYSYYNLNQFQEAIPWLEKLLNYRGKEDHYLPLAYSYQMAENYKQAIYYYERAIKGGIVKGDRVREVYLNLGICYEKINDIQNAIRYYKEVLKIREDTQIIEEVAYLYLMADELEEADEWIDKVLKLNPNKRAYGIKGLVCLGKGNEEEAKKYIKAGLEIDPGDEFLNKLYDEIKDK